MRDFRLHRTRGVTGTIPEEFWNMTNLRDLFLYDMNLSGTLSTNVGLVSGLQRLRLENTRLAGTIPSELSHLSSLQRLELQFTQLSGTMPLEICANRDKGPLETLISDCGPVDDPPVECSCCSECCNRETEECAPVQEDA